MSDIGPGDVVVCVVACEGVSKGAVERVARVVSGYLFDSDGNLVDTGALVLSRRPPPKYCVGYDPRRFRKLNDGQEAAEIIARIKSCEPIRERMPA